MQNATSYLLYLLIYFVFYIDNIEAHVETANLAVHKGEREVVKAHKYKVHGGVRI